MRSLWEESNLFICLILSRLNAVTSVIYVENGKSLTLNPNIQGKPEDILWTHNGNKVAEHDLTEFIDYGQFRRRSEIEISTGQLTVHQMTSDDSGIYRSEIQINGKLQYSENQVQVIDPVREPIVTCKLNKISRTLSCSVLSRFNVSYEWTGPGSAQQTGQELHISEEEKLDSVYTCTVKNEVSQKSSSFTLRDCDTDEPPSEQNILPLILGVIAAVVVVVTVAVVVIYIIQRKRNNLRRSGEENSNLALSLRDDAGGDGAQDTLLHDCPQESVDSHEEGRKNDDDESEKEINSEDGQENKDQEMTEEE